MPALHLQADRTLTRVCHVNRDSDDGDNGPCFVNDFNAKAFNKPKATLALARQRSKVIYKLLTTEACYDKETLIAAHFERRQAA